MTTIAVLSAFFSSKDGTTATIYLRCHNEPIMEISIMLDNGAGDYRTYKFNGGETLMGLRVQDHETLAIAARVGSITVASGLFEVDLSLVTPWRKLLIAQNVCRIDLEQRAGGNLGTLGSVTLEEAIRVVDRRLLEVQL